jgi:FkbM family methyltransferase
VKFWNSLLNFKNIRRSIITHLKSDYYYEFEHCIPLQNGYEAHLLEYDSYDSFSEIFIQREYEKFIPNIDIKKILDIGANYGYFSLWLQSQRPDNEIFSLMVEPSPRCQRSLNQIVCSRKFNDRFKSLQRVVAKSNLSTIDFFDRPFMAGSVFGTTNTSGEDVAQIRVLSLKEITKLLPPPYDLIKCDIEGSEWHLLNNYQNLIKKSKYLVLEWHSWHSGGGGFVQIEKKLTDLGFQIIKSSSPQKAVGRAGEVGLLLAENLDPKNRKIIG